MSETTFVVQSKINEYAEKLKYLNGPDDKRIKKRVLQKLGPLKKKLEELEKLANSINSSGLTEVKGSNTIKQFSSSQASMKLKFLNKELSQYAMNKQLKLCRKKFNWGRNRGLSLNVHSYANLLNAYVRCGEIHDAELLAKEMVREGLKHNTVTYTILIKGYAEKGNICKAWDIFSVNMNTGLLTERSLNAFLRGCICTGAVNSALHAFETFKFPLSSTSIAYLVTLLTQSLNISSAISLSASISSSLEPSSLNSYDDNSKDNTVFYMDKASIFTNITKSFALLGLYEQSELWSGRAEEALEKAKGSHLKDKIYQKIRLEKKLSQKRSKQTALSKTKIDANNGECDDENEHGMPDDDSDDDDEDVTGKRELSKSMVLFLQHRRGELSGDLSLIKEYCCQCLLRRASTSAGSSVAVDSSLAIVKDQMYKLMNLLSRTLYFGYDGLGDIVNVDRLKNTMTTATAADDDAVDAPSGDSTAILLQNVIFALRDKFGLDQILKNVKSKILFADANENNSDLVSSHVIASEDLRLDLIASVKYWRSCVCAKLVRVVDQTTGFINFQTLFESLPYENGSGSGDSKKRKYEVSDVTTHTAVSGTHALYTASHCGSSSSASSESKATSNNLFRNKICSLPIKLELGSGSGEWIAKQAAADYHQKTGRPTGLWIGVELKCDRVFQMLCNSNFTTPGYHHNDNDNDIRSDSLERSSSSSVAAASSSSSHNQQYHKGGRPMKRFKANNTHSKGSSKTQSTSESGSSDSALDDTVAAAVVDSDTYKMGNLAFIGGNAHNILKSFIMESSLSAVFVNHPEPPERRSGGGDGSGSQGKHMLTKECFSYMYRTLRADGTITIITDNLQYGQLLIEILHELAVDKLKRCQLQSAQSNEETAQCVAAFSSKEFDDLAADTAADARVLEYELEISLKTTNRRKDEQQTRLSLPTIQNRNRLDIEETTSCDDEISSNHVLQVQSTDQEGYGSQILDSEDAKDDDDDDDDDSSEDDELAHGYFNNIHGINGHGKSTAAAAAAAVDPKSESVKSAIATAAARDSINNINNSFLSNSSHPSISIDTPKLQLWKCVGGSMGGLLEVGHVVESSSYFDRLWKKGISSESPTLF